MYKNVIDPGKSVSSALKDIDIDGQIQYLMNTGPFGSFMYCFQYSDQFSPMNSEAHINIFSNIKNR